MRKLISLGILGLLLSGCRTPKEREHEIACWDISNIHQQTFDIVTPKNVYAFVVNGHSVLTYRDDQNKLHVILLAKNICVVY